MKHPDGALLERYGGGGLSPEESRAIGPHLATCAACRALVRAATVAATNAVESLTGGEHLTYLAMEAYVDQTAGVAERQEVESHIAACARCRAELRDLSAFSVDGAPAAVPAQRSSSRLWWLAAAAVALMAGAGVFFEARREPPSPPRVQEVRRTPFSPPATRTAAEPSAPEPAAQLPATRLSASLQGVLELLRAGRAPAAARLASIRPPGGQHRAPAAGEGEVELVAPSGIVVEQTRPRFHWKAEPGEQLIVEIFDASFRPVATSGEAAETGWRPATRLPRGTILTWQLATVGEVRRVHPRPPAAPVRFYIISAAAADEIAAARRGGDPLVLALLYAREGMTAEAVETLDALAKTRPGDAAELRRLAAALR